MTTLCGRCDREVRPYRKDLGTGPTTVWLHPDTTGLTPHHAVLGTPLRGEEAERLWAAVRAGRPAFVEVDPDAEDDVEELEEAGVEIPEPEVRARPAEPEEIPKGARDLIRAAERAGWTATASYARGTPTDAAGRAKLATRDEAVIGEGGQQVLTPTGKGRVRKVPVGPLVVDNLMVRFDRGPRRCVAVWHDGSMHCVYTVTPHVERITSTALRAIFKEEA